MAWPAGVTVATVTFGKSWDSLAYSQGIITGQVTRTHPLVWAATGDRFGVTPTKLPASIGGVLEFTAPHSDQAGFLHGVTKVPFTNWAYHFTGRITYPDGSFETADQDFQIVAGQTNVDLDFLPGTGLVSGVSAPFSVVTDIGGESGSISEQRLIEIVGQAPGGSTDLTPYSTTAQMTTAINTASTADRTRANHTGNYPGTSTSDFTAAVRAVQNTTAPTDLTNYYNKTQTDSAISTAVGAASGQDRVVTATGVTGTYTANLSTGDYFDLTLSGNTTLATSGLTAGRAFTVQVTQGATPRTFTLPAAVTNPADGVVSQVANSVTTLVFYSTNGTALSVNKLLSTPDVKADLVGGVVPLAQIPDVPSTKVTGLTSSVAAAVDTSFAAKANGLKGNPVVKGLVHLKLAASANGMRVANHDPERTRTIIQNHGATSVQIVFKNIDNADFNQPTSTVWTNSGIILAPGQQWSERSTFTLWARPNTSTETAQVAVYTEAVSY